ncbi:hypothetical protein HRG_003835 [Hirsutella rhossiliensis]|uniref:Uncharacterized protein n=1 Tax=Hirsutella rhossiliensis TaxID=111463 RepID=A0A9P8N4U0_9HYPO|nr:uncharacterized protein HRG_03835 [Hirsutella rhossiliensis]KAH0965819.1 hypothetical protein HRG_03835 [Hirsutella rhossiliensis]
MAESGADEIVVGPDNPSPLLTRSMYISASPSPTSSFSERAESFVDAVLAAADDDSAAAAAPARAATTAPTAAAAASATLFALTSPLRVTTPSPPLPVTPGPSAPASVSATPKAGSHGQAWGAAKKRLTAAAAAYRNLRALERWGLMPKDTASVALSAVPLAVPASATAAAPAAAASRRPSAPGAAAAAD